MAAGLSPTPADENTSMAYSTLGVIPAKEDCPGPGSGSEMRDQEAGIRFDRLKTGSRIASGLPVLRTSLPCRHKQARTGMRTVNIFTVIHTGHR
jgi:hypothetical protein